MVLTEGLEMEFELIGMGSFIRIQEALLYILALLKDCVTGHTPPLSSPWFPHL